MLFFFKQKTAYEMANSDWSSDVCSYDLIGETRRLQAMSEIEIISHKFDLLGPMINDNY